MSIVELYRNCRLCPRSCGVCRCTGEKGFCGESTELRLAAAVLHRGEEPPLSGGAGSGAIFVSGCSLGCVFCQNFQISRGRMGRTVTSGEFAAICLELQNQGAANVNIVTGGHAVPAIVQGLHAARQLGLNIPVLWNSSGYESVEALELLNGFVDVFLPDLKTLDSALAKKFFNAPDYPHIARAAILKMLELNRGGALNVIIRHLILPGQLESTRKVLRWFAENAAGRALLSLMSQYTPAAAGSGPQRFVNKREYETVLGWLEEYCITDGFFQELVSSPREQVCGRGSKSWLPDFGRINPFSPELAAPVWHWRDGFTSTAFVLELS